MEQRLIGTWQLVSFKMTTIGGITFHPLGKKAQGILIYQPDGTMAVQMMNPRRPMFNSLSPTMALGATKDIVAAFKGYTAYYGHYQVDETNHKVTHHLQGNLIPDEVGKEYIRTYQFPNNDPNQLLLTTDPIPVKFVEFTGQVLWQRREKNES